MKSEGFRKFSDVLLVGVFCGVALLLVIPFAPMFLASCRYLARSQWQEDTTLARLFREVGQAFKRPVLTVLVPSAAIVVFVADLGIITLLDPPNAGVLHVALGVVAAVAVLALMVAGMTWEPWIAGREWGARMRESVAEVPRRTALLAGTAVAFVAVIAAAPMLLIVMFGPLCLVSTWRGAKREVSR